METIKHIKSLVAFERVAQNKSFSKAAKDLGVSKAHISKLIQKLEDDLEQRLFNRSTRVIHLTPIGHQLFEACSKGFFTIQKAQDEILQRTDSPKGKIKISLAGAFGEETIAPFVMRFLKKYPRVEVELVFEERIINLLNEEYDFAIRVGKLENSSLIAKQIASRKEYICATPRYLELNGYPKNLSDLENHNCLGSSDTWKVIADQKIKNIPIKSNFKSNNGRAILRAALDDIGICYLPDIYVNSYLKAERLIQILPSYTPKEVPIWILMATNKNLPTHMKFFMEEISKISNKF